ncbi:MAG: hypothetical protein AB7O56_02875 [Bauldia sp.]
MNLTHYVSDLRQQLATAAEAGGEDAIAVAERLSAALEPATRLVLLDALSAAASEITRELAPGSVDIRLRGREIEFVVSAPAPPAPAAPEPPPAPETVAVPGGETEEGGTTRTTLRLPDQLKQRVEEAAGRDGLSVNSWLIRAISAALLPQTRGATRTETSGGGSSFTGWVR